MKKSVSVGAGVAAPTDLGLLPAERALVGHVVEDWVGTYFGGPMAMTREDAVRYTVEGHLKDLTAARGYDVVRDAAQDYLTTFPDALHTRLTDGQRAVRARTRTEHAEAEGRAASEAFVHGRYDDALRRVDAAELLDPTGRDYDAVRARIRSASGAAATPAVGTLPQADQDPPQPTTVLPITPPAGTSAITAGPAAELFARLEDAAQGLESLRSDLDAARRAIEAASTAPPTAARETSPAVTALDLVDAAMEAAARRLAPVVAGWEQLDLGWRSLSAAFSKVLAGDAAPVAGWTAVADVDRAVRAALEHALAVLERAAAGVAAWTERTRSALAAAPAEAQAVKTVQTMPVAAHGFQDIRAEFARLRAALEAPEAQSPSQGPADAVRRLQSSRTARAALAPPSPPPGPPAAPPSARAPRLALRR